MELGEGKEEGKKMSRPCLLQVQPQAVVEGQPPSVLSWDSTPFSPQGSGLEDQFSSEKLLILEENDPSPQAPQCREGKELFYIQGKGYFQQEDMASFPSDHKDALKGSLARLSHNCQVSTRLPCTTLVRKLQDLVGR